MRRLIREKLLGTVRNSPSLDERLTRFVKDVRPQTAFFLDYPVSPRPRYGHGRPAHTLLYELIDRRRAAYARTLDSILGYREQLRRIPLEAGGDRPATEPYWLNGWLPPLDAAALYALVSIHKPRRYFEVGSGNSTKFVRRAVRDQNLGTTILSVDPEPRAEIDAICDRCVRQPLEEVDLSLFDELGEGDILFVDCSHRVLMNSDDAAFFLDLLPRLRPGVLVEVHDIFLPSDYPPDWAGRFYSEQYVLAAYLLAEWSRIELLLPNYFVTTDPSLSSLLAPLWADLRAGGDQAHDDAEGLYAGGGSFWMRMQ